MFKKIEFPSPEWASEEGVLGIGGNLEISTLISAYTQGVFPWPSQAGELLWFSPAQRAILDFKDFHFPSRMNRYLKKCDYHFKVNHHFEAVIKACAKSKNRKQGQGTWIYPAMIKAYCDLFNAGYANSFETYNADGKLVGGLYGVRIHNYFAGESMFFLESYASQFAFKECVDYLQKEGLSWIDVQVQNPHLEKFGVKEICREDFLIRLEQSFNGTSLFK